MFSRARSFRRRRSRDSSAGHPCQHEEPESIRDDGVDESQPHCLESPAVHDDEKPRLHKSAKETTSFKDTKTDRRPNFAATPKHQTIGREDRSTMSFQVNCSGLEALIREFESPTQGREKPRSSGKSQNPGRNTRKSSVELPERPSSKSNSPETRSTIWIKRQQRSKRYSKVSKKLD